MKNKLIIFLMLFSTVISNVSADDSIYIISGDQVLKQGVYKFVALENISSDILIDSNQIYFYTSNFVYSLNSSNGIFLYKVKINNPLEQKLTDNYLYIRGFSALYKINKLTGEIIQKNKYHQTLDDIFSLSLGTGSTTINNYYECANCTNGINGTNGTNGINGTDGLSNPLNETLTLNYGLTPLMMAGEPVYHDPSVYFSAGNDGSSELRMYTTQGRFTRFEATSNEIVTGLGTHIYSGSGNIKLALYNHSSARNEPDTKLAETGEFNYSGIGWADHNVTYPYAIQSGQTYWIGETHDNTGTYIYRNYSINVPLYHSIPYASMFPTTIDPQTSSSGQLDLRVYVSLYESDMYCVSIANGTFNIRMC